MTDIEITKRCAEKMGVIYSEFDGRLHIAEMSDAPGEKYNPLHDDAQAMALLVYLMSSGHRSVIENNAMDCATYGKRPIMSVTGMPIYDVSTAEKMRRAICESVAKLPD